jgi:mono/diheme cytochrome c family protein
VAEPPDAGPPPLTDVEVEQTLVLNCQSCHSLAYVRQQRMTVAQWTATLTKMRGWGALLEEQQLAPMATALATMRGPTAALPAFAVQDVKPFSIEPSTTLPSGSQAKGKTLFETRCLVCHGPDAHGSIGVNLVDRSLLQQPTAFQTFVKSGRGRMPPHPDLSPTQFGELLAFLRSL